MPGNSSDVISVKAKEKQNSARFFHNINDIIDFLF